MDIIAKWALAYVILLVLTPGVHSFAHAQNEYINEQLQAGNDPTGIITPPSVANTNTGPSDTNSGPGDSNTGPGNTNPGQKTTLVNPITAKTITDFLIKIVDIVLVFMMPLIIFFIMYAGFLFVTARGNESKVTTARSALLYAIIGGVLVLGAHVIIQAICGTVSEFGSQTFQCNIN